MDALQQLLAPQTAQARERRVFGVVAAKVHSIDAGGLYRLEYLSMSSEGEPSAPARVMTPMAGGKRGVHFFPEVGDEVVVAFELGDTNLPVILGAVHNNNDPPPDQAKDPTDNNVRTIVSRSGHELTFDDTAGSEKVLLKSKGGHSLTLDDAPGTGKVTLTTASGLSVTLDDTPPGSVSVKSAAGVEIAMNGAGTLSLSAPLMLQIKGGIISLEGNVILLKTTGQATSSLVTIDGKPFGLHTHGVPPGPVTPPVTP